MITACHNLTLTGYCHVGHSGGQAGQSRGTGDLLQAALNRWPENNDLLLGYGNLLFARGKPDEALAIYTRLIDEEPDNAPALNNLAYTLYQLGRYTEALPYASKATRIGGEFQDNFQETRDEILIAMASLASNQEMP